jgi:hypothetical protein
MIMLLNLGIGLCHPPVGAILFVGCAVGKVTIEQVMRKIWPFYAVMFVVLMSSGSFAVAAAARAAINQRCPRATLEAEAKSDGRTDVLEVEKSARQSTGNPRPHHTRIGIESFGDAVVDHGGSGIQRAGATRGRKIVAAASAGVIVVLPIVIDRRERQP